MGDLIRKFDQDRKDVGHVVPGNQLNVDFLGVVGWHLELEEDDKVIWRLVASNYGAKDVRVVYCKPFTFGPWKIEERMALPSGLPYGRVLKEWRADNEDHFFYFEINIDGQWVPMDGSNSTGTTNAEKTVGHMEWHSPQEVHLEVRLKGV